MNRNIMQFPAEFLVIIILVCQEIQNAYSSNGDKRVYVIHYRQGRYIIPVTVEIDYEQKTEHVLNLSHKSGGKSITFYDFREGAVAYKYLNTDECFISHFSDETLEDWSKSLKKLDNKVINESSIVTLWASNRTVSPKLLRRLAGEKIGEFCKSSASFLLTSSEYETSKSRSKRSTTGVNQQKGQFTHRSYGHYGHQSHNYAHYGHESYSGGEISSAGEATQKVEQYQIRKDGPQVTSPTGISQSFVPSGTNEHLGGLGTGESEGFALRTRYEGGYQLNQPLGLRAGSQYRGALSTQGQYTTSSGGLPPGVSPTFSKTPGLPTRDVPGIVSGTPMASRPVIMEPETAAVSSKRDVGFSSPGIVGYPSASVQNGYQTHGQLPCCQQKTGTVFPDISHVPSLPSLKQMPARPDGLRASTQPSHLPSEVAQPAHPPSRITHPGYRPSGIAQPGYPSLGIARPGYPPSGITQLAHLPSGISQPGYPSSGIASPGYPPSGITQPGRLPSGSAQTLPSYPPSGISQTARPSNEVKRPDYQDPLLTGSGFSTAQRPACCQPKVQMLGTVAPDQSIPSGAVHPGYSPSVVTHPGYPSSGTAHPGYAPSVLVQPSYPPSGITQPGYSAAETAQLHPSYHSLEMPPCCQPKVQPPGIIAPLLGISSGTARPGYPPSGIARPGYPPSGTARPGYPPSGTAHPGYPPSGIAQPGYPPSGTTQPGYPPSGRAQPSYPPSGITQPGYPPSGRAQPGYPVTGTAHAHPSYPSPVMPPCCQPKVQPPKIVGLGLGIPSSRAEQTQPSGVLQPGYPTSGISHPDHRRPPETVTAGVPLTGYPSPGEPQPGYPSTGVPQPGYPSPGVPQSGYPSPGVPQSGYPSPSVPRPGYPSTGIPLPGYPSPGKPLPGYPSPGIPHPGYPSPGIPLPGYPSPGIPLPGYLSPGQPQTGYQSPGVPQPDYPFPSLLQTGYPPPGVRQPGYPAPGALQPGYPSPVVLQQGYPSPAVPQQGYPSPGAQQPVYPSPGVLQPGYPSLGVPQPGYPSPGVPQPGYLFPGVPQPGHPSPGLTQPTYPPLGVAQPGYPSPVIPQPGYPSPVAPHPDYPSPGASQPAYPQLGFPQQGYPSPGIPQPAYLRSKDDTAVSQTQVQTGYEGTAAEAASIGRQGGLGAQTQVQGGYTGNGSFSAQAQSGFTGGVLQSQVRGGKQGGSSGSSAQVERLGSAQSQVQVGRPSGAATGSAQGKFFSGVTQVQAQSGKSGGSAGAQAQSRGTSSSQVQVNVAEGEAKTDDDFQGGVSASVSGGYFGGQAQTQLQGGYDSGRTYVATAQGGFDSTSEFRGSVPGVGSIPEMVVRSSNGRLQPPNGATDSQYLLPPAISSIPGSTQDYLPRSSGHEQFGRMGNESVLPREYHIPNGSIKLPENGVRGQTDASQATVESQRPFVPALSRFPGDGMISTPSISEVPSTGYSTHLGYRGSDGGVRLSAGPLQSVQLPRMHEPGVYRPSPPGYTPSLDTLHGSNGRVHYPPGVPSSSSQRLDSKIRGTSGIDQATPQFPAHSRTIHPHDFSGTRVFPDRAQPPHDSSTPGFPSRLPAVPSQPSPNGYAPRHVDTATSYDQRVSGRFPYDRTTQIHRTSPPRSDQLPYDQQGLTDPLDHSFPGKSGNISREIRPPSQPLPPHTSLPTSSVPTVPDCCKSKKEWRTRCCDSRKDRQHGVDSAKPQCCVRKHPDEDKDFSGNSDSGDSLQDKGSCRIVKAVCYLVYKPNGRARVCKPTGTRGC